MNTETEKRHEGTEPRYIISVAARMLGIQVHTLRYYEKIGVVEPRRSRGNIRLYSDADIDLLRRVKALMDEMGINVAGAEVVVRMVKRMSELQAEVDRLREALKRIDQDEEEP